MNKRIGIKLIGVAIALVLSSLLTLWLAYPLGPVAAVWLGLSLLLTFTAGGSTGRAVALNFCVLFFVLLAMEIYAWKRVNQDKKRTPITLEGDTQEDFHIDDPVLGYAPDANRRMAVRKKQGDRVLYDVEYSIGANGLRVAYAGDQGVDNPPCILFFGGSFTYGEGVEDEQTTPYRVGRATGLKTVNFGFRGYGPHQMLAAIDSGMVEDVINCRPVHAIYQTIDEHVERATGNARWSGAEKGPHYEPGADGKLRRTGSFSEWQQSRRDAQFFPVRVIEKLAMHSWLRRKYFPNASMGEKDFRLFGQIIDQSRDHLKKLYPDIGFSVILWDYRSEYQQRYDRIRQTLESWDLNYYLTSQAIPEQREHREKYLIAPPSEMHPSAEAYLELSQFIVDTVLASRSQAGIDN